ncbi:FtsX-like permease family protein [Blastopirellula sp. JC732]|uniref:FtsX-like permease family protein n=1 Tax=Blastopirellula sediminis TaxID=2894196 RepID=A0A9X1SGM3_9BACT|nr:FtsX-like permease family protein [Blastopirellula sediminis]MCC9607174.1 FtsX-like permease family protein [Blastopirellula sediminis]MCC9629533.1 FtsX-like permease family protein [Blastopirellula sediminis]
MLDRKLGRDLLQSRGLLLAIVSIMTLGIGLFVGMQSTYHSLSEAKQRYYANCRVADFWVDLKKLPLAEVDAVRRMEGIRQLQPRIQFAATVDLDNRVKPLNGLVIAMPEHRQPVLNDIMMVRGSYFTGRRENEVVINDKFAAANRISPGDWIHLLMNDRRQEFFVVGTAISAEFTYLLGPGALTPDPENFGVFYVPQRFAEDAYDFSGAANQLVGAVAPGTNLDRLLDDIELQLSPFGVFSATPLKDYTSNYYISNEIEQLATFATFLPSVFLAVAALVLNVLMTRLARQQRVVVGTFKAIGYSDWTLFIHFLKYGAAVGVAGSIGGSALGMLLTQGMTAQYQTLFQFPDLHADFFPATHLTGLAVSLFCSILGSLYGARSMLVLKPVEAMRSDPPKNSGRIWLEHFPWLWGQLSSPWRAALRGMFRNRVRTAVAIFASMTGASILVAGLMMYEATDYFIRVQFEEIIRSDIDLSFKDVVDQAAINELRRLPGADLAEPMFSVACTLENGVHTRRSAVMGIAPGASLTSPRNEAGEPIAVPEVGLTLDRQLANILNVGRGDLVVLRPVQGDQTPKTVPVAQICDGMFGLSCYADIHYLNKLRGEEFAASGAQLKVNPAPGVIDDLYRELKRMPAIESVNARIDMINNMRKTFVQAQLVMIFSIILFAGIIFFGSVLNATLINLSEREREAATLGAIGYTRWEIGAMFLRESMLANVIGTLLGFPLGYQLVVLMTFTIDKDLIRFPVVTAPWIYIAGIVASISFALLAHAVVQRRINTMNLLEALQVKE